MKRKLRIHHKTMLLSRRKLVLKGKKNKFVPIRQRQNQKSIEKIIPKTVEKSQRKRGRPRKIVPPPKEKI